MANIDNSPFANSELTTILVVADLAASRSFYVDILGADLIREYGGSSIVLKFLGNWLLLVTSGGPTEDKPEVYFNPPADANNVSHSFTIRVEDCDATYNILEKRGAKFITPPLKQGAETRCFFHDPDGHLFEISEYHPED